jgi:hypothetical protein
VRSRFRTGLVALTVAGALGGGTVAYAASGSSTTTTTPSTTTTPKSGTTAPNPSQREGQGAPPSGSNSGQHNCPGM